MSGTRQHPGITRRRFCSAASGCAAAFFTSALGRAETFAGQSPAAAGGTPTRPDVAAIDRSRILAAADRFLSQPPGPLTSLPCSRSPGTLHDFYSEANPSPDESASPSPGKPGPPPFTAHRDALFQLGLAVPALAGAWLLTGEDRYAQHALLHLRAWFIDPATSMTPRLDYAQTKAMAGSRASAGQMEGILETLPLVEVAQAIPFLATSAAFSVTDTTRLNAWFRSYLNWLTAEEDSGPRLPQLARDHKDHHATSWLLQTAAYTLLTLPESTAPRAEAAPVEQMRRRFRSSTLRAQFAANGSFPHELSSPNPYRNSLLNLDMMAAICLLLSTRFDSVWDYELEDGPGMRSAIAYHFPFIADRSQWPFRADTTHFDELPGRRVSLLFTARAYQRPEYAALWTRLPPDPPSPDILRSIPIHQPLLWVSKPPRTP